MASTSRGTATEVFMLGLWHNYLAASRSKELELTSSALVEKKVDAEGLFRKGLRAARGTWMEFSSRDGSQAAAAFSFYVFLSLFALLALAGGILGMILGGRPELYRRMVDYVAEQAPGLSEMVREALNTSRDLGGVLGIVGFAGLLLTGTKATDSFQLWMCRMWDTRKPPFLKRKLKGLVMLMVIAGAAVLGFGTYTLLLFAARRASILRIPLFLAALACTTGIQFGGLAFIYHYSLEEGPGFLGVWKGALLASLLINPTQLTLTWYYSRLGNLSAVYGTFAAVILSLTMIFYTSYVVFFGAALNRSLAQRRNAGRSPGA
jgi:membrane protein